MPSILTLTADGSQTEAEIQKVIQAYQGLADKGEQAQKAYSLTVAETTEALGIMGIAAKEVSGSLGGMAGGLRVFSVASTDIRLATTMLEKMGQSAKVMSTESVASLAAIQRELQADEAEARQLNAVFDEMAAKAGSVRAETAGLGGAMEDGGRATMRYGQAAQRASMSLLMMSGNMKISARSSAQLLRNVAMMTLAFGPEAPWVAAAAMGAMVVGEVWEGIQKKAEETDAKIVEEANKAIEKLLGMAPNVIAATEVHMQESIAKAKQHVAELAASLRAFQDSPDGATAAMQATINEKIKQLDDAKKELNEAIRILGRTTAADNRKGELAQYDATAKELLSFREDKLSHIGKLEDDQRRAEQAGNEKAVALIRQKIADEKTLADNAANSLRGIISLYNGTDGAEYSMAKSLGERLAGQTAGAATKAGDKSTDNKIAGMLSHAGSSGENKAEALANLREANVEHGKELDSAVRTAIARADINRRFEMERAEADATLVREQGRLETMRRQLEAKEAGHHLTVAENAEYERQKGLVKQIHDLTVAASQAEEAQAAKRRDQQIQDYYRQSKDSMDSAIESAQASADGANKYELQIKQAERAQKIEKDRLDQEQQRWIEEAKGKGLTEQQIQEMAELHDLNDKVLASKIAQINATKAENNELQHQKILTELSDAQGADSVNPLKREAAARAKILADAEAQKKKVRDSGSATADEDLKNIDLATAAKLSKLQSTLIDTELKSISSGFEKLGTVMEHAYGRGTAAAVKHGHALTMAGSLGAKAAFATAEAAKIANAISTGKTAALEGMREQGLAIASAASWDLKGAAMHELAAVQLFATAAAAGAGAMGGSSGSSGSNDPNNMSAHDRYNFGNAAPGMGSQLMNGRDGSNQVLEILITHEKDGRRIVQRITQDQKRNTDLRQPLRVSL